ncbi:EAL and HDOD domain-containing protein [Oceanisphaera pacifica]|uniref:EAL domain-containing protein n=1 Tax=Oceanisphaera pacifica TaxID=2818389 RepID=A0ABS3NIV1_9GAMM|nr:HDOD domain-containing protein [Oceanisphaera pacifica]MBO1520247.1 EAL domain-containing protein [Oceanisphaera pacifica]
MRCFVARQAILDGRGNPFGYELLFRTSLENRFPEVGAEVATRRLMAEQFLSQKIEDLVGQALCFVNFPDSLLREGMQDSFAQQQLVIEILEDATPDDALLDSIKFLKRSGFKTALDDHVPHQEWEKFFPYIDFIKLDLRQFSIAQCAAFIKTYRRYSHIQFIAEKVETQQEYTDAKAVGFDLFQGYYFQQPQVISRRILTTDEMTGFELLAAVNEPELDYDKLAELFSRDLSLSYYLLRHVNSLHSGYKQKSIDNLRNAIVFLGHQQLRRFTALMMTAYISKNKNIELYRLSMIRAKWCELLAEKVCPHLQDDAFICGLFSLLDALLERPIADILPHLSVTEPVQQALLEQKGQLGFLMGMMQDQEQANWFTLEQRLKFANLNQHDSSQFYEEAIQWSNRLANRHNT